MIPLALMVKKSSRLELVVFRRPHLTDLFPNTQMYFFCSDDKVYRDSLYGEDRMSLFFLFGFSCNCLSDPGTFLLGVWRSSGSPLLGSLRASLLEQQASDHFIEVLVCLSHYPRKFVPGNDPSSRPIYLHEAVNLITHCLFEQAEHTHVQWPGLTIQTKRQHRAMHRSHFIWYHLFHRLLNDKYWFWLTTCKMVPIYVKEY